MPEGAARARPLVRARAPRALCPRPLARTDNALQDLGVRVPRERLQVVGRKDKDVLGPAHAREELDPLRVAALDQRLHRLDLVAGLRVLLAREVVVALALEDLGDLESERVEKLFGLGAL